MAMIEVKMGYDGVREGEDEKVDLGGGNLTLS